MRSRRAHSPHIQCQHGRQGPERRPLALDNRGCACAWRLYWLDGDGKRVQYGEVQEEAAHVQPTFPGHVWLLEASDDAAADRSSLRYAAVEGTEGCVAVIARDARCVAAAEQRAAGSRPAS